MSRFSTSNLMEGIWTCDHRHLSYPAINISYRGIHRARDVFSTCITAHRGGPRGDLDSPRELSGSRATTLPSCAYKIPSNRVIHKLNLASIPRESENTAPDDRFVTIFGPVQRWFLCVCPPEPSKLCE